MQSVALALQETIRSQLEADPILGRGSKPAALAIRSLFFEDLSVGMTESLTHDVLSAEVLEFAELTGDRNPIHLSDEYASHTQFHSRIAHGLYTASLISAVLGTRLPGPGAIYISQSLNFRAPVHIGDAVVVEVAIAELVPQRHRARLACSCKVRGELVLDGEAWVKVPARP
jgi:3-hydroxybutyryl-CoA dehydratase